jgi:hypothetical protein
MGIALNPERRRYLEALFPMLAQRAYAVRGAPDKKYNCVAWAMGFTDEWWWPDPYSIWPHRERRTTVASFTQLLQLQGFEPAANAQFESGYLKIAMYVLNGVPTHMARIESPNLWSSKLGRDELIEHEPDALNGSEYGKPEYFFRKKA